MSIVPKIMHTGYFLSLTLLVLIFSGCAKYEPFAFHTPHEEGVTLNNVEVKLHQLREDERKSLFAAHSSTFANNYRAVQIHVFNDSNEKYRLIGSNISLPIESYKTVKKRIRQKDFWKRVLSSPEEIEEIRKKSKKKEKRLRNKTINRDTLITIQPGLTFTGIFFVRKEHFSPEITIKLIDKENRRPLYFDMYAY